MYKNKLMEGNNGKEWNGKEWEDGRKGNGRPFFEIHLYTFPKKF